MHGDEPAHPADPAARCSDGRRSAASTCGWSRRTTPTAWPGTPARTPAASTSTATTPTDWADLDGNYESGPRPASEPETRAMMRFLRDVRPTPDPQLPPAAATAWTPTPRTRGSPAGWPASCDLPAKRFDCGGVCHGTMTMWYNHHSRARRSRSSTARSPSRQPDARAGAAPAAARSVGAAPLSAQRLAQRPSKTGFSLATNAATAAWWSSVAPVCCIIALSNSSASSKECPAA